MKPDGGVLYMQLSVKAKEAIKLGLAMVLAYGIAMQLGWENPFWAALTVATASVLSTGQSLGRATMRTVGTALGALAAVVIFILFPQDRWLVFISLTFFLGFCTYMMTGKSYQYLWFLAAFTSVLIMVTASPISSQSVFTAAVMRTSETALGAFVYALVAVFLWPIRGGPGLYDSGQKLIATQAKRYRNYLKGLTGGRGVIVSSLPLRTAELQLLAGVGQALSSAEVDDPEVQEVRQQWQCFCQDAASLQEALDILSQQAFHELASFDLSAVVQNIQELDAELEQRFAGIENMFSRHAPDHAPRVVNLAVNAAAMAALTRQQQAATDQTIERLKRVDRLTWSLFASLSDIRGYKVPAGAVIPQPQRISAPVFDPDRWLPVVMVVVTFWAAALVWIYINPPGGQAFVLMAAVNALIYVLLYAKAPYIGALNWVRWWGFGVALAGLLYFLVLPHLSGFFSLAILIFVANFGIYYLFGSPPQLLARMLGTAGFAVCLIIDNQQTYSFSTFVTFTFMIMGGAVMAVLTRYLLQITVSPTRDYLRLRRRFFQRGASVMARLGEQAKSGSKTWFFNGYLNDLLLLPQKLFMTGKFVNYLAFPQNSPQQVQELTTNIDIISLKLNALVRVSGNVDADQLDSVMLEGFRGWNLALENLFQAHANNPAAVTIRDRQLELSRIGSRMQEMLAEVGAETLSDKLYAQVYRLTGAYQGVTEAMLDYAEGASEMRWEQWQERRF
jgi:uncharacterized membrane protein YccC